MKTRIVLATTAFIIGRFTVAAPDLDARQKHVNAVIDLWSAGKTAFGVFVPNENPAPRGARPETGPLPDESALRLRLSEPRRELRARGDQSDR
jgi:hypothetical protein